MSILDAPEGDAKRSTQLVLGLGNPLRGDDGVGPAVTDALSGRADLRSDVRVVDGGTPGLETILYLQDCDRAIIVDAAEMGLAAGAWVRFGQEEVELHGAYSGLRGTLHGAGLAEALHLGEALDLLPDEIVIYGIQPGEVGWSVGLSDVVQDALPDLCSAIIDDLKRR
jgi:hydrogenase maturation protease